MRGQEHSKLNWVALKHFSQTEYGGERQLLQLSVSLKVSDQLISIPAQSRKPGGKPKFPYQTVASKPKPCTLHPRAQQLQHPSCNCEALVPQIHLVLRTHSKIAMPYALPFSRKGLAEASEEAASA